jgi:hypothetical protein
VGERDSGRKRAGERERWREGERGREGEMVEREGKKWFQGLWRLFCSQPKANK